MLIPIGSWCRTAYQVSEFLIKHGIKPIAYPYDWTITPFGALEQTLCKDFQIEGALCKDKLIMSKFGSILDDTTQLIHHHDFAPPRLKSLLKINQSISLEYHWNCLKLS